MLMSTLEITYPTLDVIPEPFRPLYEDQGGVFTLTKVNGLKSQKDIDALSGALAKERNDHKLVKDSMKVWEGLDPTTVRGELSKIEEYKAASAGKLDEAAINKLVESRLAQKAGPLEASLKGVATERDDFKSKWEKAVGELHKRDLNDSIRAVATDMKVHATALPDIEMVAGVMMERVEGDGAVTYITKAGLPGITPGLDMKGFLKEMQKLRPHWWPQSAGGGAGGGNGLGAGEANPFSFEGWNVTKQGQIITTQGQAAADMLAKAAGTTVGGPRPVKK
jgi:hypothetical protein